MANQDRVNFIWAESALTTIPPIPVSEVAYRDTTQTSEQMEVGQQYDTLYNSARHNQLLFLLTSVAKTLCENGMMPFLAGQEYSQYARCIFTDGKLYTASRAILANEQPYPTPGDDSGVWIAEETSGNLVPNSRRVIAGTGLTGGGPLSSDVTLSAKLDGKTTRAAADGAITVKDVAIDGDLGDLASARGQIGAARELGNNVDYITVTEAGFYLINATGGVNGPIVGSAVFLQVFYSKKDAVTKNLYQIAYAYSSARERMFLRQYRLASNDWSSWSEIVSSSRIGDGLTVNNGIISVPEYEGATASAAGTSGLVPPAAAGQQNHLLTGGGAYISKVPNATHADTADNSLALAGRPWLESLYTDSAGWLIGSVDEKLRPVNTGSLKVYYANSAGSAPANGGTSWATTVMPNVAFVGRDGAIPNGGTWLYVYMPYDHHYLSGAHLAGGATAPSNDGGIAIRIA